MTALRSTGLAAALCLACTASMPALAQHADDLADASNFAEPFGPMQIQATEENDGTVTLTRQAGTDDAGIDWMIEGEANLPITLATDHLNLTPTQAINDGYYVASLLFFNAQGDYLAEAVWVSDTNELETQTLESVSAFAAAHDASQATHYRLRLRVHPVSRAGAGFAFDRIAATPPPSDAE